MSDHLSAQDILDITHLKMLDIANKLIREIESFARERGDCSTCQTNLACTLALDVIKAMALVVFSCATIKKEEETAEEVVGKLSALMMAQIYVAAEKVFTSQTEPSSKLH